MTWVKCAVYGDQCTVPGAGAVRLGWDAGPTPDWESQGYLASSVDQSSTFTCNLAAFSATVSPTQYSAACYYELSGVPNPDPPASAASGVMLVLSPGEYAAWQSAVANSPFNLSPEEGAALSAAILAVWGTAWGIRALIRVLKGGDTTIDD